MSTRATIRIEGFKIAKIYKHWDGYPEATLEWLENFNKEFTENRGIDPMYKFAQLLRSSVRDAEKFNLDPSPYTGWGVVKVHEDCGQEFEYMLHANGKVSYQVI